MILVNGTQSDRVEALDRGLAYGDGVFRTIRAQNGRIPFWRRHYDKLASDCRTLSLTCPTQALLRSELNEVVAQEPDCVLKVVITRGVGGRGYAPPQHSEHTRLIASFPLPKVDPQVELSGVCAIWCRTRLAVQPLLAGVKHLNRIENVLARAEWTDPRIAEGIMLDTAERVIEGTSTNLFLLEEDRLVTPDLRGSGVAGVQRERLIEAAARAGLACSVEDISRERVCAASQLLLVNSVIGLWWVAALEGLHWKRGEQTVAIMHALGDLRDDE